MRSNFQEIVRKKASHINYAIAVIEQKQLHVLIFFS